MQPCNDVELQLACYMHPTCMYIVCILAHTVRIAESREPDTIDYTGQIRQFSEIGPGGPFEGPNAIFPRPWVCYVSNSASSVQWQTPDGMVVPTRPSVFTQAVGDELYLLAFDRFHLALIRGPDYTSPDGDYCCAITTVPGQRRCVTLSECAIVIKVN